LADKLEVAGPGFINIHLKNQWLAQQLAQNVPVTAKQPQIIVVDYSGPNLAKEMHVGHLRSTIIGDAVARVLAYQGHQVIRQNHVGDWGTQFGMLIAHMVSLQAQDQAWAMQLADLESFYREAKKRFDSEAGFADLARDYVVKLQSGDAECRQLWQQFIDISLNHCETLYKELGVQLTRADVKAESSYNDDLAAIVQNLKDQQLLVEDNGAQCVFLETFKTKDGSITPIIVQKSDGGYLYATTDLAALRYRSQVLNADRVLYFTDARQALHFQQVFSLARQAEFVKPSLSLEHMPFGNMLGEDNKPFKTRTGGTVKLIDVLTEAKERVYKVVSEKNPDLAEDERQQIANVVGVGAVKYADLSKNRVSDYIFNWDNMLSLEGNTAPYLQYAYARIQSIFRKAGDIEFANAEIMLSESAERNLAIKLLQFTEAVDSVAKEGLPNHLSTYLYELAGNFMTFYEHCPILKDDVPVETRNSRLNLAKLTADTLKTSLSLLGIDVLDRM
jgi:arginyl-tRNA synthetase